MSKPALEIVLETEQFVVINKCSGIPVHREEMEKGVLEHLESRVDSEKLYLCHRLDRDTSGLLLVAKDKESASELSQLFERREIQKYYLAISDKRPKKSQGLIAGDMVKARQGSWKLTKNKTNAAKTQFFSRSHSPGYRSFLLKPLTGRTHQIRVALAALGSTILGDGRYKGTPADRLYLHAYQLQFEFRGQSYLVKSLPDSDSLFSTFFQKGDDEWAKPELIVWPQKN